MATQPPLDPKILTSWEDAFQYPLPVVRRLEQQLRKNIDENRSKLRSLVGTSYRDLLGTAERIIEMDGQIQQAETYMSDIGRKCNARALERIADNHARMMNARAGQAEKRRCRVVAQTKVLQNALAVTGRIIRSGGDALLAAKLLVLARLLHKGLAEGEEEAPAVLEDLRSKLGKTRKRLLGYISRSLVRANMAMETTVQALCAYSLITSSAPKDVLRYFMQIRFEQLEAKAETPSEASLLEMLDLYSQTLLDTKELFPRRFADSLSQLSKAALIRDTAVHSVAELSLDVYEQWIADDLRNFHPWVRHDQLASSEVASAASSWAKQAQSCLLQSLRDALDHQSDARPVLAIRQQLLSKYLSLSARLRNEDHARAVDDIRIAFLGKLEELADRAAKMSDLAIGAQPSGSEVQVPKVWDLVTEDLDLKEGTAYFRKAVMDRQHGRSASSKSITHALDDWTSTLQSFAEAIATMRTLKWDDDLDLELDDLTDGESLQTVLSKQDPQQLELRLHRATAASFQHAYSEIERLAESVPHPAILIRIVRDVDQRRRALSAVLEKIGDKSKASDAFIAILHKQVATKICEEPLRRYGEAPTRAVVALWDGTPALPVQPSPATYRLVKDLHWQMSDVGNDLWSPNSVQVLKGVVGEALADQMSTGSIDERAKVDLSNGHAAEAEAEKETSNAETTLESEDQNRLVQKLFDLLYLQRILTTGPQNDEKFGQAVLELQKRVDLEDAANERLKKSANEYWRRTYLLFGLLAAAGQS